MRWIWIAWATLTLTACANDAPSCHREALSVVPFVLESDLEGGWMYSSEVLEASESYGLERGASSEPRPLTWAISGDYLLATDYVDVRAIFEVAKRFYIDPLCARTVAEGNALRVDWSEELAATEADAWTGEEMQPVYGFVTDIEDWPRAIERDEQETLLHLTLPTRYESASGQLLLAHHFERID